MCRTAAREVGCDAVIAGGCNHSVPGSLRCAKKTSHCQSETEIWIPQMMNPAAPWWFAMDDIRNPSSIPVDTSVRAPVSETPDAGKALEEDQRAFHDALAKGGELNESQSPETRRAIKRSLDGFQASSGTKAAAGSSESDSADASRGRSTRPTSARAAGAVAGGGPVPAMGGTRRRADAGGKDPVTAQGGSRRTDPVSPPDGDGRNRGAAASSWPLAKTDPGDRRSQRRTPAQLNRHQREFSRKGGPGRTCQLRLKSSERHQRELSRKGGPGRTCQLRLKSPERHQREFSRKGGPGRTCQLRLKSPERHQREFSRKGGPGRTCRLRLKSPERHQREFSRKGNRGRTRQSMLRLLERLQRPVRAPSGRESPSVLRRPERKASFPALARMTHTTPTSRQST